MAMLRVLASKCGGTCHRYFVPVAAVLAVVSYVWIYGWLIAPRSPVTSDGYTYFVYLPAWVLYDDPSLQRLANHCCGGEFKLITGLTRWPPTGQWVDPHPIGVAVLILPFYLVGHWVTLATDYPLDGFSFFYRHAAGLSSAFYLGVGLWLMKRFLDRHFARGVVLATLISITFGTNLFHYATFDALWSHVYSFFLFAAVLNLIEEWNARPTVLRSIAIGLLTGLIFLVRHVNLLFVVCLAFYGVVGWDSLRARLRWLWSQRWHLAAIAIPAFLVALPQLALYQSAMGHFYANPYRRLLEIRGVRMFNFADPHILGALLWLPKGLFFWSPVLLVSVAGLFMLRGRLRSFLAPAVVFLTLNTWMIVCWFDWQAGGSYGHRSFTESIALLAIPMAAAYSAAAARPRVARMLTVLVAAAVVLSVLQMIQYWLGILPYSDITWEQYRSIFLRLSK